MKSIVFVVILILGISVISGCRLTQDTLESDIDTLESDGIIFDEVDYTIRSEKEDPTIFIWRTEENYGEFLKGIELTFPHNDDLYPFTERIFTIPKGTIVTWIEEEKTGGK